MTDYATIEALASRLCHDAGGNWEAKYTKRMHWRRKAADLYANQQPPTRESLMFRFRRIMESALFAKPPEGPARGLARLICKDHGEGK